MKKNLPFGLSAVAVFFSSTLCLIACGDGEINEITEESRIGAEFVASGEKMPDCSRAFKGWIAYAVDSASAFACDGKKWVSMKGRDGMDGADGLRGLKGDSGAVGASGENCRSVAVTKGGLSGLEITCGMSVDTLWSGVKGDSGAVGATGDAGANCESRTVTKDGLSGLEITCGTSVDTLWNGARGDSGAVGASGKDCKSATVTKDGRTGVEITCDEMIDTLWSGKDGGAGANCESRAVTKDGLSGLEITCGMSVDTLWNGAKGDSGAVGASGKDCKSAAVAKGGRTGVEITCGETIDTLWNGDDGDDGEPGANCESRAVTKDGLSGLEITCGTSVDTLWNGNDGNDGDGGCTLVSDENGVVELSCGVGDAAKTLILYKAVCGSTPYDPAMLKENESCVDGVLKVVAEDVEPETPAVIYNTVEVGGNVWMVESMDVETQNSSCNSAFCYYTWDEAQTVCPEGFRLPTNADVDALVCAADKNCSHESGLVGSKIAHNVLGAKSDWKNSTDAFGFSLRASGFYEENGGVTLNNDWGFFWTSQKTNDGKGYNLYMTDTEVKLGSYNKNAKIPVRCVRVAD